MPYSARTRIGKRPVCKLANYCARNRRSTKEEISSTVRNAFQCKVPIRNLINLIRTATRTQSSAVTIKHLSRGQYSNIKGPINSRTTYFDVPSKVKPYVTERNLAARFNIEGKGESSRDTRGVWLCTAESTSPRRSHLSPVINNIHPTIKAFPF